MTKHLYLVRHAQAVPGESRQDDKTRELTQSGIKDALHAGIWLREQGTHFDLLVSSSALRAEQTMALLAEGMKEENVRTFTDDILYEASVRQFLDFVNNLEDTDNNVLVTGHNPTISYLAEYLTKADINSMATASIAIIKFDIGSWKEVSENTGHLVRYVTP